MTVGLVCDSLIIRDINLNESNLNYSGGFITVDHDVSASTQYTSLSAVPTTVYPVAGLVNTSVNNLQTQINSMVIPSGVLSVSNPSGNLYVASGTVGTQNITLLKVLFY
jgi:hypothetical protein